MIPICRTASLAYLSVHPVWASNSIMKRHRKTITSSNVSQSRSNQLPIFSCNGPRPHGRQLYKYLGIHIVSGKLFNIDVSDTIRKFYAAANAIAYRSRRVNEMARLSLFETFTLPIYFTLFYK